MLTPLITWPLVKALGAGVGMYNLLCSPDSTLLELIQGFVYSLFIALAAAGA